MKKITLLIFLFILSISSVQAKENKLYFTEENNRLYYESKLIDENIFMKHINMTPGDSYTDELLIENGTKTKYTLYFKVVPKEQSSEANELLENIIMKIKLDDKLIYDGKATGLNYNNQGINLQDAILLGVFTPSKNSKMIVETKLKEEYDNTNSNDLSYIDWSFYAQYEKEEPIIINPKTSTIGNNNYYYLFLAIIPILLILFKVKKESN